MVTKKCEYCGKEFQVINSRRSTAKYCSKECANKGLHGNLNCKCEICGKPLHRKPSQIKKI